jgi:hypothetical protein
MVGICLHLFRKTDKMAQFAGLAESKPDAETGNAYPVTLLRKCRFRELMSIIQAKTSATTTASVIVQPDQCATICAMSGFFWFHDRTSRQGDSNNRQDTIAPSKQQVKLSMSWERFNVHQARQSIRASCSL